MFTPRRFRFIRRVVPLIGQFEPERNIGRVGDPRKLGQVDPGSIHKQEWLV